MDRETTCYQTVRRGGPSSGGGYDAMNFTREVPCGKASVTTTGRALCKGHAQAAATRRAALFAKYGTPATGR
jgi:hypothetical protein